MKKYILPIIVFVMFMPLIVNAETCDIDKISISSITIKDKSEQVDELEEATAIGKNINLNLSMSEVGDSIEYKFVLKNDSNDDYELNKNSFNIDADHFNYSVKSDDNSNVVKANSSKTFYLRVQYKNEVPDSAFESGTYRSNKSFMFNLSTGQENNLANPNTKGQFYILLFLMILFLTFTIIVLLRKKKYSKIMLLIVGAIIIIPISVYAICKCDIKVNSDITIKRKYTLSVGIDCPLEGSYISEDLYSKFPVVIDYYGEMTWNDLMNSRNFTSLSEDVKEFISSSIGRGMLFRPNEQVDCLSDATSASEIDSCVNSYTGNPDVFGISANDTLRNINEGNYYNYMECKPH